MSLPRLLSVLLLVGGVAVESTSAQRLLTTADLPSLARPPQRLIAYGPGPLQFGRLRMPMTPGPHPVVVFIHGGCWLSAFDIAHGGALEEGLAAAGYAVWSLEYRRVGDAGGGWPGTFTDIADGADHLRTLASRFPLDLSRTIAAGHSAGGALALWLAARAKLTPDSELFRADPLRVAGVLALAPAPDLERLHGAGVCGRVIDSLMGGSPAERAERYAAASPMQLVPIGVPQVLVIGAKDRSWAPVGRSYYDHAVAAGDTVVRLIEAAEAGHFELIAPASRSWAAVRAALQALLPPRK